MKKYIIALSSIVLMLSACGEYNLDNPYKEADGSIKTGTLTAATVSEPADGFAIDLDATTDSIDFKWAAPGFDGTGLAISKLVFDVHGGDFSVPVASFSIANPDTLHKKLSNAQAKTLFASGIVGTGTAVTLDWCVKSSAGGQTVLSERRSIVFNRRSSAPVFGVDAFVNLKASDEDATVEFTYEGLVASFWKWEIDGVEFSTKRIVDTLYTEMGAHTVKLGIRDSENDPWLWTDAYDYTVVFGAPFVPGDPLYIAGTGAKEAGRHMVYMPNFINGWNSRDFNDNNNKDAPATNATNNPLRMWQYDYEIFTELVVGKPLYFWSGGTSLKTARYVFVPNESGEFRQRNINSDKQGDGDKLIQQFRATCDTTFTVRESGVYRIRYNSSTGEYIAQKINFLRFRYWPNAGNTNNKQSDMVYQGNGVWKLTITPEGYARGFKFLFFNLPQDQPHGFLNIAKYPLATMNSWTSLSEIPEDFWYICSVKGGPALLATEEHNTGTWPFFNLIANKGYKLTLHMNDDYPAYKLDLEFQ